jgi:hypothetical protein
MIATIIRLKNSLVMVFDAAGEQVPPYQGWYLDVKERILRDAPANAAFTNWFGYNGPDSVPRENW